jgi:hypothetical protein
MRTRRPLAAFASLFLVAVAVPATAFADESGTAGSVSLVDVNTPSADTYLEYHGRVVVLSGKTTKTEYRWGGTSCGTRVVPADMVEVLVEASRNDTVVVTPSFQVGQGDAKCLVGFTVNKKR